MSAPGVEVRRLIKQVFILCPEDQVLYSKYLVEYAILFPDPKSIIELDENSTEGLILNLFLSINTREKLIEKLRKSMMTDKTFPPDYFAMSLIQSFCALLLVDIDTVAVETIIKFVDGFAFGVKCLPQCQKLSADLLINLIVPVFRMKDPEKLKVLIPKLDEAASLFAHRLSRYSLLMFSCVCEVLNLYMTSDPRDIEFRNVIIAHLKLLHEAVDWENLESMSTQTEIKEKLIEFLNEIDSEIGELKNFFPILSILLHFIPFMHEEEIDVLSNKIHEFFKDVDIFPAFGSLRPCLPKDAKDGDESFQVLSGLTVEKTGLKSSQVLPSGVPSFVVANEAVSQALEFLSLSSLVHGHRLFHYLFRLSKNWILKGNLVLEAIIFVYIWKEDRYRKEISHFCDNNVFWLVMFNDYLFNSQISMFSPSDENSRILVFRSFVFDVIELLMRCHQESTIFDSLLIFLNKTRADCAIFTEVIFFIATKVGDLLSIGEQSFGMFVTLLAHEIIIQQSRHLAGDTLAGYYRPVLMESIESFTGVKGFIICAFKSVDFLNSLFSLFFEVDMFTLGFRLLQCLVDPYVSSSDPQFWSGFLRVVELSLGSVLKQVEKPDFILVAIHLCEVIQFFVSQDDADILRTFATSQSFDMLCKMMTVESPVASDLSSQMLSIGFNILITLCSRRAIEFQDVPWMSFLPAVKRVTLTSNLLAALRANVSMSNNSLSCVENPHALQLLVLATEGTDNFRAVLESLCLVCQDSIWNCFSCFKSGVLFRLFDMIVPSMDGKLVELILQLFDIVNAKVSSKQLFCRFARLLEPVDGKFLHPKFIEYAKVFELLLPRSTRGVRTFLHFSSESQYLKFRGLTQKEIQSSFSISLWLLLDPFPIATDALSVLHFEGRNATLHFFLTQDSIWISFHRNGKLVSLHPIAMTVPTRSWFNLLLRFSIDKGVSVYRNGEPRGGLDKDVGFVQEYESVRILSSYNDSYYPYHWVKHGQFCSCAVFTGVMPESLPVQIFRSGPDAIFTERTFGNISAFYTSQIVRGDRLINTVRNSPMGDAVFDGTVCNFVASFLQIFELSNGVAFLTTLWSQLLLTYENGQPEPQLALLISSMFLTLIRVSAFAQVQMRQIDSYSVIAHFLTLADTSYLTGPLWKSFFAHFHATKDEDLKQDIAQKVLFNYSIWSKMSMTAAPEVFQQWRSFFRKDTYVYWSQISLQFLLDALDGFIRKVPVESRDSDKQLQVVSHAICLSLFDISLRSFSPDDAAALFVFSMKHRYRSIVMSLLKLLESQFAGMDQKTKRDYLACLINFCPLLFFLCDEVCKEEIIRIFSKESNFTEEISIFLMIVREILNEGRRLAETERNEYQLSKESVKESLDYLLIALCGMSVGSTERTFDAFGHLSKVTSVFHFFCSFIVAMSVDSEMQTAYTSFIANVTSDITNHADISDNLTPVSVLLITFYAVFSQSSMIPMMAAILYRDSRWYHLAVDYMHMFHEMFHVDITHQIVQLMLNTISFLISYQSNKTRVIFLREFLNEVMFTRRHVEFPALTEKRSSPFEDFLSLVSQFDKGISFGYSVQINTASLDMLPLSKMLLQLTLTIVSEEPKAIPDDVISALLYCCTLSRKTTFKTIGVFISKIIQHSPRVSCIPLMCNLSQGWYDVPQSFISETLKTPELTPSISVFAKTQELLAVYYASNTPGLSNVSAVLKWFNQFVIERSSLSFVREIYTYDETMNQVDTMAWNRLYAKLINERCAFFTRNLDSVTRHYRRGSYFDYKFRPILLTPVSREIPVLTIPDTKIRSLWTAPCRRTTIGKVRTGQFYVLSESYMFVSEKGRILDIESETVTHLIWRWELMVPNSIEIFTSDRKSYLFTFPQETSHSFVSNLTKAKLSSNAFVQKRSPASEFQQQRFTEHWLNYSISTYEYLMWLNMFSGRSFHDASAYPVFPWILTDYDSTLFDPEKLQFRDLTKPIGALNEYALERAKQRNASLGDERTFLYQTGYSNAMIISHYLVRLQPFSDLHIRLQDGHFDNANRLFQSISQSFSRLIESGSSFRELTPEFFFCPEFLTNIDNLPFEKNDGKDISDVELPKWAASPVDFVQKHVEALESDRCSEAISQWIDLVFGYRQTGKAAQDADNTFDPLMYATGYDPTDTRREYVLKLVGQIPFQLFNEPHPARKPFQPPPLPHTTTFPRWTSPVVALLASRHSPEDLRIYAIHSDGKCYVSNSKKTQMIYDGIPMDQLIVSISDGTFSCATNDSLFIFNPMTKKLTFSTEAPNIGAINSISSSKQYILTGGCDSMLALWRKEKQKITLVSQSGVHDELITCVAISEAYGIAVSCSSDNRMALFRLPSLDLIRFIDLHLPPSFSPAKVVIQKGMGYISVFCEIDNALMNPSNRTMVLNFTINGILIGTVEFNKLFRDVISVTDRRSLDHLVVLDNHGNVTLLNGYSLADEQIFQSGGSVGHIHLCGTSLIVSPKSTDATFVLLPFQVL